MTEDPSPDVEREITALLRQAMRMPVDTAAGPALERPAYAVLGRLHDDGPMRVSALATVLGVDPSTASRQGQALVDAGFVVRVSDPDDRRAARLQPTDAGREALLRTRARRREVLERVLEPWSEQDRESFAALLQRFNVGLADATGTAPTSTATATAGTAAGAADPQPALQP